MIITLSGFLYENLREALPSNSKLLFESNGKKLIYPLGTTGAYSFSISVGKYLVSVIKDNEIEVLGEYSITKDTKYIPYFNTLSSPIALTVESSDLSDLQEIESHCIEIHNSVKVIENTAGLYAQESKEYCESLVDSMRVKVVQEMGDSEESVMSQKAVTDLVTTPNPSVSQYIMELTPNDNLDDITCRIDGITYASTSYSCSTDSNALLANNYPEERAGTLTVLNSYGNTGSEDSGTIQQYSMYSTTIVYERRHINNKWTDWELITFPISNSIDTASGDTACTTQVAKEIKDTLDLHANSIIAGEKGAHNLRYHDNRLQYKKDDTWVTILNNNQYKIMTAIIDTSNLDPDTCISYQDDAIGMSHYDWDKFFGHYPCILKDGVETIKLDPNNFSNDIIGNPVDLASDDVGDVMIAFPRLGFRMETTNKKIILQFTNNLNDPNFSYYAHRRGDVQKDKFYLGAFKGCVSDNKLHSWAGQTHSYSNLTRARNYAQANGPGYENSGFYQLVFRQAMYIMKYGSLDSQNALGKGATYREISDEGGSYCTTGNTLDKGMDWGETTGKLQMKLFGIEDFWGNAIEWIDGVYQNSGTLTAATDNFNSTGEGYIPSIYYRSFEYLWVSSIGGTTESGFVPTAQKNPDEDTGFCTNVTIASLGFAQYGGRYNSKNKSGIFDLYIGAQALNSYASIGSRLMYL